MKPASMQEDCWRVASDELDRWRDAGRIARLWLRDDDAIEPTPALDSLTERLRDHAAPCLVAVIPMLAGGALAGRLASENLVKVAMHGASHANHAPAARKSEETAIERGVEAVLAALSEARDRLAGHFGRDAARWYVPPWNRIHATIAARLPELGFEALSAFGSRHLPVPAGLRQLNTHVDIMDWRGGRTGKPEAAVAKDLAAALAAARADAWRPVGILTHHLVHDDQAWAALDALLALAAHHEAAVWSHPDGLLREGAASGS